MTFYLDHISYDNVNDLIGGIRRLVAKSYRIVDVSSGIEMHHPDTDVSIELYLLINPLDQQEDENKRFNHGLFNHVRGGVHDLAMAFIDHWTDYGTDNHISDEGTAQWYSLTIGPITEPTIIFLTKEQVNEILRYSR